jgi:hypothetical protein
MKWITLTTAPNEPIGQSWVELLASHGIPTHVAAKTMLSLAGGGALPVRIMVPEDRLSDAEAKLEELVGPWDVKPAEEDGTD